MENYNDNILLNLETRILNLQDFYFYNELNKISNSYPPETIVSKQKYGDIERKLISIKNQYNDDLKKIIKSVYPINTNEEDFNEYYGRGKKKFKSYCETLLCTLIVK